MEKERESRTIAKEQKATKEKDMEEERKEEGMPKDELGRKHLMTRVTVKEKEYYVSTVELAFAHGEKNDKLFETMIFKISKKKPEFHKPIYEERYRKEEEAIIGHAYALKWLIEETGGKNG